jgi:SNF2 family DNA or RNA helicase
MKKSVAGSKVWMRGSKASSLLSGGVRELLQQSGKLQVLVKLLRQMKRCGHKTLIFSQYARVLDLISEV